MEIFGEFLKNLFKFKRIFPKDFLGEFLWEKFFGKIFWEDFLGGFFWEEFFVYIGIDLFVKILVFVKILSQGRRRRKEGNLDP